MNTGNTKEGLIREQRRLLLRQNVQRDAGKKGARRARYGKRAWLEAQQVPGRLRWPHAWKRRLEAATARRAPNAGRSEVRDALIRRARAQSGAYNYEERTRAKRSEDAASDRGRRTASTEWRRPERNAGKAPMRRMIRMGELGVKAVGDAAAREAEV